ncbi:MAG: glycosyltransferase [Bacteroidia bacterium]
MLNSAIHIFEIIFLYYIGFNIAYVSIYIFLSNFYKRTDFSILKAEKFFKYAVIIPAYKSDEIIEDTLLHALNQTYPKQYFDVIIIGDTLKPETEEKINNMPVIFFPVKFEKSTKAKSLNHALDLLPEVYDFAVILDVDNIILTDFLEKINLLLQDGRDVVQAHRCAKNLNTSFAVLDAISEEINNTIFRKGHVACGLSSSLVGSGKAIRYNYFKKAMANIHSAVEDKELETALIKDKIFIYYEDHLRVFDEKVSSAKVFTNQRKRWIASQFFDFQQVLFDGLVNFIVYNNFDYFDKSLQRVILPRILILGLSFVFIFTIFIPGFKYGYIFFFMFVLCLANYLIAIPAYFYNTKTLKAAINLPYAFLIMLYALLKSKGNAKTFNSTPKTFKAS